METCDILKSAQWIWLQSVEKNAYAGFAKEFDLDTPATSATLTIFADTHYKLYINGRFVNAGPAPFRKPVIMADEYDVAPFLRAGRNVIFIFARFIGEAVKYNNVDRPGVIAALQVRTAQSAAIALQTDDTWLGFALDAWTRDTPKITWALGGMEEMNLGADSYRVLAHFAGDDYAAGEPLQPVGGQSCGVLGQGWGTCSTTIASCRWNCCGAILSTQQTPPRRAWLCQRANGLSMTSCG